MERRNLLCAQIYLNHLKLHKKIFGYDTFEGMTEPSEHDIQELQTKSNETNKIGIKKSVASLMRSQLIEKLMKEKIFGHTQV